MSLIIIMYLLNPLLWPLKLRRPFGYKISTSLIFNLYSLFLLLLIINPLSRYLLSNLNTGSLRSEGLLLLQELSFSKFICLLGICLGISRKGSKGINKREVKTSGATNEPTVIIDIKNNSNL